MRRHIQNFSVACHYDMVKPATFDLEIDEEKKTYTIELIIFPLGMINSQEEIKARFIKHFSLYFPELTYLEA